jgi:hypothetical protein
MPKQVVPRRRRTCKSHKGSVPYPKGSVPYPKGSIPYPKGSIPYPKGSVPYHGGFIPVAVAAEGLPLILIGITTASKWLFTVNDTIRSIDTIRLLKERFSSGKKPDSTATNVSAAPPPPTPPPPTPPQEGDIKITKTVLNKHHPK